MTEATKMADAMTSLAAWMSAGAASMTAAAEALMQPDPVTVDPTPVNPPPDPEPLTDYSHLPVVTVDVEKSNELEKLVTTPKQYSFHPDGCVILWPEGVSDLIAPWWSIRLSQSNTPDGINPGATFVLRGPGRLVADGGKGLLTLENKTSEPDVRFVVQDVTLSGPVESQKPMTVYIPWTCRATFERCTLERGYDCIMTGTNPICVDLIDCHVRHGGGVGNGKGHNLYFGYNDIVRIIRCDLSAPKAQGHVLKCYARHLELRDSVLSHYDTDEDLADGFYGVLPLLDRGAWGSTVAVGNTFIRRGPTDVRRQMVELRNRVYPVGYSPYVDEGWGTEPVDPALVDNTDDANPHLFRHLFHNNRFLDEISDGRGVILRNNGTTPDDVVIPERQERCVAYLSNNTYEGALADPMFERHPYQRPDLTTPIRELDELPAWAEALV